MIAYDLEAFDFDILNDVKKLTGNSFAQIIGFYIEDGESYINTIKEGIANNDQDAVAKNAHPFKSSSRSVGAIATGSIAEHIELSAKEALKNNSDIGKLKSATSQLEDSFEKSCEKLKSFLDD